MEENGSILQKQLLAQIYLLVIIQQPIRFFHTKRISIQHHSLSGWLIGDLARLMALNRMTLAELRNIALDDRTCLRVTRNLEVP